MSSILTYNSCSLPFIKTEKFSQEPIYSADNVDLLYHKVTIGVSGVLSSCQLGSPVADWIVSHRAALLTPMAQLYFVLDGIYILTPDDNPIVRAGQELVASPNYGYHSGIFGNKNTTDAKWGPQPQRFDVKEFRGESAIFYYEIVTYIPYCGTYGITVPNKVLSNRWSTDIDFDENFFQTRTINGVCVLNGQYVSTGNFTTETIDSAFQEVINETLILPYCPKRWKRESMKIARSADGLTLNYNIVDKQLYAAIPRPATHIDAQYTETCGTERIALMNLLQCEITVTVHGEPNDLYNPTASTSPDANKYALMQLMFMVVFSRLKLPFTTTTSGDLATQDAFIIQHFQMKEDLFQPIVGCTVKALKARPLVSNAIGKNLSFADNVFSLTEIGQPIPINDIISDIAREPNLGNYGTLMLCANALSVGSGAFTACMPDILRTIHSTGGYNTTYPVNTAIFTTTLATPYTNLASTWNQTSGTNYGTANYHHPFTEYTLDVQYLTNGGILQLPKMYSVAGSATSCVFAQLSSDFTRKVVHWKAARVGQWPMAPKPTDAAQPNASGNTDQLLSYHLTFADAQLMSDGVTRRFEAGGVYEVGMSARVQWDVADIKTAVNPITNDIWGSAFSTFPTTGFVSGIVGYATGSPGGI